jgi:hypothetical protein
MARLSGYSLNSAGQLTVTVSGCPSDSDLVVAREPGLDTCLLAWQIVSDVRFIYRAIRVLAWR